LQLIAIKLIVPTPDFNKW